MFIYMFCVLKISDTRTGVPFYICNAPDSPHNQRPLFILMGKESAEIIGDDIKRIDRERHALCEGFILRESGVSCSVESNDTLIDAKMRKTLSGLGGHFVYSVMLIKIRLVGEALTNQRIISSSLELGWK